MATSYPIGPSVPIGPSGIYGGVYPTTIGSGTTAIPKISTREMEILDKLKAIEDKIGTGTPDQNLIDEVRRDALKAAHALFAKTFEDAEFIINEQRRELEQHMDAILAIQNIHQPVSAGTTIIGTPIYKCVGCGSMWPCATLKTFDSILNPE